MVDRNEDSSSDVNTQTAFAVIAGVAAIFVALVVLVFYIMRDKTMSKEILDVQRRFDAFKAELQTEQQKKMFKYSKGIQEFLKQYKKPILQSAFDLQSRLTNQVKNNFLYSFLQERGGERDKNYALYNFSFVFAEFLGWLEVIRQEMVFVTGDDDTPLLASLIDGIKFQLTGETPIQGTPPPGQADNPEFEAHSKIFQLYAGELRSIGSVMIITDADGNKSILNADEFQRLMTVKAPPETLGNEAAYIDWARSRERLFQDMMLPLFDHLRHMAKLPKGEAPIRRLAIFQVLLCKLIDLIDNAIPWDSGPKYDPMEEVQYITRDFRLTPLVACLNSFQRSWLASQMFMENAEKMIADELWDDYMEGRDPVWRKLCFCGFREDIAHLPQDERDKKPGMWPGACPPKLCRTRQPQDPKTGRNVDRSTSFFTSHHRSTRERDREPDKKDKDGSGGGGLSSVLPIGKRNPSLGARVLAGMPGAMSSGKLPVPTSTPPTASPHAPPAKIPDANPELKKGVGGQGKPGKGGIEVLPKSSSLERLQQSKLQPAPHTPTSSDADSLNNSTPSSSQLHQQQPMRYAGEGFQAITIKGNGLPPIHLNQAPPPAPPHLITTNPALNNTTQSHMSPSQPGLGQLPASAASPTAVHLHADSSNSQGGSDQPLLPPRAQAHPSTSPTGASLLAGTGIASSAALQRGPTPPRPTHPLKAATLAQHTQLQQQQQQQQQQQHPHEPLGVPHPSIQLPNTATPFHVANTGRSIPAIRKWGTQNRMAAMGVPGSNRVSPMQGSQTGAPQAPSSPHDSRPSNS